MSAPERRPPVSAPERREALLGLALGAPLLAPLLVPRAAQAQQGGPAPAQLSASGLAPSSAFGSLSEALGWQRRTGGAFAVVGETALSEPLELGPDAALVGVNPRQAVLRLTSPGAGVVVGGPGRPAAGVTVSGLTIKGEDVARVGFAFSDAPRGDPRPISWSVFTGGGHVFDLDVAGCREAGIVVGADSDNTQMHLVRSRRHRAPGTAADGIRIEAPTQITQSLFGGVSGYALRADVAVAGGRTPEMLYTVESSRLNFGRKGLIYHDGTSDTGPGGAVGIVSHCFLENCGFAGGEVPAKEPADEATLEPAAIHCAGGRLAIHDPKKLQSGWGRSLVKASRAGQVTLRLGGCEAKGATNPRRRPCTLLVAGLEAGHSAQIVLDGPLVLADVAEFAEIARTAPRAGDFAIRPLGAETLWRADLAAPEAWTPLGAELSATGDPGRLYDGPSALAVRGQGWSDAGAAARFRLPRATGRPILLQAVLRPEGPGPCGLHARLSGPGLRALTPLAAETPWTAPTPAWIHLCAAAWVEDGAQEIEATLFAGRGTTGGAATVGMVRVVEM
ncbi:hypothetical protein P2H44_25365 [Albimonas sp. CAU 1670]|uniref:hypothetical protein n=1 Tax=Albimonas sp. CAU 1670 TaxID=3032599 RepID=UPI0023DB916B|nr:hypothetical protein [Albimonas sp. CAU 1670]MDF2235894.1 hypothetical protein [Albimonas sp. CAU 1670]